MSRQTNRIMTICPYDGHEFEINIPDSVHEGEVTAQCPYCVATHTIRIDNVEHTLKVEGTRADEVEKVSRSLIEKLGETSNSDIHRSPWISGSFYLFAIVLLISLFLIVAKTINIVVFPIIIIGGLLALSIVGAFQLRQDKNLSEKKFVELMALTFKQLPFILKQAKTDSDTQ